MTTVVIGILSTTGDGHGRGLPVYTSAQAWEDAAPADLVAADQIWRGECYNDGVFASASGTVLSISGSTSDATRYKELTTAAGQSFSDSSTAQTNPLRFNSSVGVAIRGTAVAAVLYVVENYARLSGLQVSMEGSHDRQAFQGNAVGVIVDKCIFESIRGAPYSMYGSSRINNSLIVVRNASSGALLSLSQSAIAYNCTVVAPSNYAAAANAVSGSYGTCILQNCAFFGCTAVKPASYSATFTNCITDAASPPTGCTTVAYDTASGSGFANTADSTRDFKIKSTSALINAGVTDSVNAGFDIVGTARPQSAAYDVGCWEYVSAAAVNLNPFVNRMSAMAPILAQ